MARTLGFILSAGHSPAKAADVANVAAAIAVASVRTLNISVSLDEHVAECLGSCDTIVENPGMVKCLVALGSIAQRYVVSRKHVLDVGGKGRIGVDLLLELTRGD